jgi:hypothetical protein
MMMPPIHQPQPQPQPQHHQLLLQPALCEDTGQGGRYRLLFFGNSPKYDECMLPLHMKDQHELNVRFNCRDQISSVSLSLIFLGRRSILFAHCNRFTDFGTRGSESS